MENLFENIPLTKRLLEIESKNPIVFHIPGHGQLRKKPDYTKEQKEIYNYLKEFANKTHSLDITEISLTDNLQNPTEVIKQSTEKIEKQLDKSQVFVLVNGTTCGNLANIHTFNHKGSKVIIEKNCHKSVFNAVKLNELQPITIENEIDETFKIPKPITKDQLKEALEKNQTIQSVILTSPTYYGETIDLQEIYQLCNSYNVQLILDSAHGAHFHYIKDLKTYLTVENIKTTPLISTVSYHKTLPCLTQCSAILVQSQKQDQNLRQKIQNSVNIFQSTSPSYLFMSSIFYGHEIAIKYADNIYANLKNQIKEFKSNLQSIENIRILDNQDYTRLVISIKNITGYQLEKILETKYNIYLELSNENSIVLVCNMLTTKSDLKKLEQALIEISKTTVKKQQTEEKTKKQSKTITENIKQIPIENALNKICAENIVIYPPGTVLIKEREKITENHIKTLKDYVKNNKTIIYSINHDKDMICVYK